MRGSDAFWLNICLKSEDVDSPNANSFFEPGVIAGLGVNTLCMGMYGVTLSTLPIVFMAFWLSSSIC